MMGNNSPRQHTPTERDELCEIAVEIQELAGGLEGSIQLYTSKFMPLYIKGGLNRVRTSLREMNDHIEKENW